MVSSFGSHSERERFSKQGIISERTDECKYFGFGVSLKAQNMGNENDWIYGQYFPGLFCLGVWSAMVDDNGSFSSFLLNQLHFVHYLYNRYQINTTS